MVMLLERARRRHEVRPTRGMASGVAAYFNMSLLAQRDGVHLSMDLYDSSFYRNALRKNTVWCRGLCVSGKILRNGADRDAAAWDEIHALCSDGHETPLWRGRHHSLADAPRFQGKVPAHQD